MSHNNRNKTAYGIAIVGLNGSGKSTLAHAFARTYGYLEMDVEDYYFPHQSESRRMLLDGLSPDIPPDAVPFALSKSREEVEKTILAHMCAHPKFVLSGVHLHWSTEILCRIRLVCRVHTPKEVRLCRIRDRDIRRFGERVLPGGDMYHRQCAFYEMAAGRDEDMVDDSIGGYPVLELDGTMPVEENCQRIWQWCGKETAEMLDVL